MTSKHKRLAIIAVIAALLAALVIAAAQPASHEKSLREVTSPDEAASRARQAAAEDPKLCAEPTQARRAQDRSASALDYTLPVNPYELDDAQLATVLDTARDAGIGSISSGAAWWYLNDGQQSTRSYDWSGLDRLLNGAEARGMTVKLQLSGTPDWVHPDLKNTVSDHSERIWYPPRGSTELGHWSNFVSDVVSRYQGRIIQYKLWNEPNISDFWRPEPKPAEYAALLRAGYLSAKIANPDASVVFGGPSRNDVGYLEAYYSEAKKYPDAAGNKYFFDVMNVQPYSSIRSSRTGGLQEPLSPDANTPRAVFDGAFGRVDQNFLGIKEVKAAMDAQGDTGKNIFLGEYGFSTTDTWMEAVPDERRALFLKRAYVLAGSLPYVEGMSWYSYHPTGSSGTEWSILDADLEPTMTFRALKQTTGAEPAGATVALSSTPDTCSISGTYKVSPAATDLGPTSGWELYVDGELQGTYGKVPIDWDTTGVADGTHTLMVAAYTQEGSVWPSNVVSVTVDNAGG